MNKKSLKGSEQRKYISYCIHHPLCANYLQGLKTFGVSLLVEMDIEIWALT